MWRVNFDLRTLRVTSWYLEGNCLCNIRSSNSVISYGHQKNLSLGITSKYEKVIRKPFPFFYSADCTNNNYHFRTLLALTTIFIIHQCGHIWVASTAQPGAERAGNLQFSNAEEVPAQKKQGHLTT